MEYPLIIDGKRAGTLSVEEDGLFTVFEAAADTADRLVRLAVYGGGAEGYLGVMQPWSGGMYLHRRLTHRELAAMPQRIEYAAPAGQCTVPENTAHEANMDAVIATDEPPQCAENAVPVAQEAELMWFKRPDGTLTAFDGVASLVAIPAELRHPAPHAVLKELDGRTYMIFRY